MPKNLFPLDNSKKFTDQKHVGHNRWHPDIPAPVTVKPGDAVSYTHLTLPTTPYV